MVQMQCPSFRLARLQHKDPDYSGAYVVVKTDRHDKLCGFGLSFTLGRGTEIVVSAIKAYGPFVIGLSLDWIFCHFGEFWRWLVDESQLRWIGPEKGALHTGLAGIINALWDLWARIEGKPVWKLLVDMEPKKLLSTIDFKHIDDALTKEEALEILQKNFATKSEREQNILEHGYPAYITSVGWLGYDESKIRKLCRDALAEGWTRFKMKVGLDVEKDSERAALIREVVGWEKDLMMDANQVWSVQDAIVNMKKLAPYKPKFIEEPTHPDDVLGHAKIADALNPEGIGVATGEVCCNRVMFKQYLQSKGLQYCQIDSCRMAGLNEVIAVLLMAAKFQVPVWPHAGGVGLCEMVQHISIFDYICISPTLKDKATEYADHLHEHFTDPPVVMNGAYLAPKAPGYSTEIFNASLDKYDFLEGSYWRHDGVEPSSPCGFTRLQKKMAGKDK
ncbi:mitochondrial enolase superfamily member 1-like isoform X2 [Xenia sp. Carnegie-2017]|uniref:mitochondrial enolase superfamily member 1-like isoform X2 n=1 Tax=Xenia sp. Carnegie-2017 TaxID=2897299 RepID=UPI001F044962|nr:mitochondrial enolase superfamily member 1-like isoform X2 [Xenia sp. Carnegie-2017]